MNKNYTTKEYYYIVCAIRENFDNASITTDIMVGFPNETEEEFNKTLLFLDKVSFAKTHVFKYSRRKGTRADTFNNQIDDTTKENRSKLVIELSNKKSKEFNKSQVGKEMPVLIERFANGDFLEGYTTNYVKVLLNGDKCNYGEIVDVVIKKSFNEHVFGSIIEK